jgi:hypothetical protein
VAIVSAVTSRKDWSPKPPPFTAEEVKDAKQRIAKNKPTAVIWTPEPCCAATTACATPGPVKCNEKKAKQMAEEIGKSLPDYHEQLAAVLVDNSAFVEALTDKVNASSKLVPSATIATEKNVRAAIALYVAYNTEFSFSSTEGAEMAAKYTLAGYCGSGIRKLAIDMNLLKVASGTLASTKYTVSKAFETLLLKTLTHKDFEGLNVQVNALIENILATQ